LGCGVDLSGADHGVGHNLGSGIDDDDVQEVPSRDDNASAPISTEKKKR
jgi:hypothetical protein